MQQTDNANLQLVERQTVFTHQLEAQCQAEEGLRHLPADARNHVEAFMREVERWSLELQRHNAQAGPWAIYGF